MAFDGNGNWTSTFYPTQDRDNNIPISASKFEEQIQTNQKVSFENCATIDSQTKLTAPWDFNTKKGVNLTNGTASTDAVNFSQLEGRADTSLSNLTAAASATEVSQGVAYIATDSDMANATNDTKFVTPYKANQLLLGSNAYGPGFIKDFLPTYVDADNISCAGGDARDAGNTLNISDDTTITKDKSLTWALGTGGGTASGESIGNDETFHMFVLAGGISPATAGTFTTDDISGNIASFQAITDGYLTYRVNNGALEKVENLDFSSIVTIGDIATVLDAVILNATITAVGNTIKFSSLTTGSSSSFIIFLSTETGTDMYPASYLDGDNGLAVQGIDARAEVTDYGYDTDVDATNLMVDTNVIAEGFNKYRRIASFITNATGEIIEFRSYGDDELDIRYLARVEDYEGSTANVGVNITVSIPLDAELQPRLFYDTLQTSRVYVNSGDSPFSTVTIGFLQPLNKEFLSVNGSSMNLLGIRTDELAKIWLFRTNATGGNDSLFTLGYLDKRS